MNSEELEKNLAQKIKIYLDEDCDWNVLIAVLKKKGFTVISPRQVKMIKKLAKRRISDEEQLTFATSQGCVLLSRNKVHFPKIHRKWKKRKAEHAGILILYRHNNPKKDMSPGQIANAIGNIIKLNYSFQNQIYNLNDFNY